MRWWLIVLVPLTLAATTARTTLTPPAAVEEDARDGPAPHRLEPAPPVPGRPAAGREADEPVPEAAPREGRVRVSAHGVVRYGDRVVDPGELREILRAYADGSRDEGEWKPVSNRPVVVSAEPDTPWPAVREILQTCARPNVMIWRTTLVVGNRAEKLLLPRKRLRASMARVKWDDLPTLTVGILREPGGDAPLVRLLDREMGTGPDAFGATREMIGRILQANPGLPGSVEPGPGVLAADVLDALRILRVAGIKPVEVDRVAPRYWPAEDLRLAVEAAPPDRALDLILERPRDDHPDVQCVTAEFLHERSEEVRPMLVRMLSDPREERRQQTVHALGGYFGLCWTPDLHHLPDLVRIAAESGSDENPAADLLVAAGERALPVLEDLKRNAEGLERAVIGEAIERIRQRAAAARAALTAR